MVWNLPLFVKHFHSVDSIDIPFPDPIKFWKECLATYEISQAPKLIGFSTIREITPTFPLTQSSSFTPTQNPSFTKIREKISTPIEEKTSFDYPSKPHSPIQVEPDNSQDTILCEEVNALSVKPVTPQKVQQTLPWSSQTTKSKKKVKIL